MIKKLLMFGLLSLFLVSSVSAYTVDYGDSSGDLSAYVSLTINYPYCEGVMRGGYCVGDYVVDVSFIGDKFYMGYSYNDWTPRSYEYGMLGIPLATPGNIKLPIKNGHPQMYIVWAWDKDTSPYGSALWVDQGYGWLGDVFDLDVVECYNELGCSYNEYCDMSSDWTNWNCIPRICSEDEEQCSGFNLETCNNNAWVDSGLVINKCGIECLSDSQCNKIDSEKLCEGDNVYEITYSSKCESYKCIDSNEKVLIEECNYGCVSGLCIEKSFLGKILPYVIGSVILILLLLLFFIILKKKSKRGRK